ncbi:hypothetical protein HMN09_01290200 [Mycena chlorophos]|uniref:F-box domain-containing protein n=1 Tax=Mycena chlorophos TaxID=658473 RepID=A0A8H6S1V5_MYCCL|nr:hypothetical protein HMN09_01290200 [Mycena chlorophos]
MADVVALAGVMRLPPELLSEIFVSYSTLEEVWPMHGLRSPLALGLVCTHWRSVAISTSQLWTSLHISCADRCPDDIEALLALWLARSGAAPLSFCFQSAFLSTSGYLDLGDDGYDGRWTKSILDEALFNAVLAHSERWSSAIIATPLSYFARVGERALPLLESIDIRSTQDAKRHEQFMNITAATAPQLHHMSFSIRVAVESVELPWAQLTHLAAYLLPEEVHDVFRLAPNLIVFDGEIFQTIAPLPSRSLHMPCLRTLRLCSHPSARYPWLRFLLYDALTLPALEILRVSYEPIQIGSVELEFILDLLLRSECTLTELLFVNAGYLQEEAEEVFGSSPYANVIRFQDSIEQ